MKKPYVAIVDDDSAFSAYLRTFLSLRGYEARCYTRGDEMLASMKQSEAPDVVLEREEAFLKSFDCHVVQ